MDRSEWLQSLQLGDIVCTVTARSPLRVSVKEHIVRDVDAGYIKCRNLIWIRKDRPLRSLSAYVIPNTTEAIAEETAYALLKYRRMMAEYRLHKANEDQLTRIEAILKERKRE